MASIVVYDPSDTVVPGRVTSVDLSAHTPNYVGNPNTLINPDLSGLVGVSRRYWKFDGGSGVEEMSSAEKTALDDYQADLDKPSIHALSGADKVWVSSSGKFDPTTDTDTDASQPTTAWDLVPGMCADIRQPGPYIAVSNGIYVCRTRGSYLSIGIFLNNQLIPQTRRNVLGANNEDYSITIPWAFANGLSLTTGDEVKVMWKSTGSYYLTNRAFIVNLGG